MLIKTLQVRNFRNLLALDTAFEPGLNVIHGRNAQGKTNLLEAIYLLVTGRSFRTANDAELIPWHLEEYTGTVIRANVLKKSGEEQLGVYFDGKAKRVLVNGTPITRLANLVGHLNAVLFTPTDLLLVRGAPSLRRRFLDIAIGQTSRIYMDALQQYQTVLKNRNILLKAAAGGPSAAHTLQLDVYDQQLVESGSRIIEHRARALADMSRTATDHYGCITANAEPLHLVYEPDITLPDPGDDSAAIAEAFHAQLRQARRDDLRRLATGHGPHRDDFGLQISGYAARQFASQGQQRSAVLAIKFAEMDFLHHHTGERPLLMLDDVISELDEERRRAFLQHLQQDVQTFITTTDASTVTGHAQPQRLLQIRGGHLSE